MKQIGTGNTDGVQKNQQKNAEEQNKDHSCQSDKNK